MKTMKTSIRRLVASTAAVAAAGAIAAGAAAPAQAAGAADCLDRLSRGGIEMPTNVTLTPNARVPLTTSTILSATCSSVTAVSIAISRTDITDLRNAMATRDRWEADAYFYYRNAPMGPKDIGTWMIRQITVKDRSGLVLARSFTTQRSPNHFTVRRGTVISSRQHGTLARTSSGWIKLSGDLKAYNSLGGLSPLAAGQRILVQARRPGSAQYVTVRNLGTASSGWFSGNVPLAGYNGADVRFAYITPYQTIASSFTYVGRVG
jgi:hypothetical protein